jgi:hypothetical protein
MRRIELKSAPLSTLLLFSMLVSLLFISFVEKSASAPLDTWGGTGSSSSEYKLR